MNNYRDTLTAAARVLSIMRDDAQKEMDELKAEGRNEGHIRRAGYRRTYAANALEALLCVDPENAKDAERWMRARHC